MSEPKLGAACDRPIATASVAAPKCDFCGSEEQPLYGDDFSPTICGRCVEWFWNATRGAA